MLSCDTIALSEAYSLYHHNMLGKNSDRPLGESQPLTWIPGKQYAPGTGLQCTHLRIPQVEKTLSVLGSKPWWIWGFEMGINECGVVIANEAQGSRNAAESAEGLLGMDLLRLGLERGKTAQEAIAIITQLLEQYGQNANASTLFDRRYENSYMLMDSSEVWLLETAGRQWVARQIHQPAAISNCYTIGTSFDQTSDKLLEIAAENHWLSAGEPFDFAKAYTLPASRQTHSIPRWRRMEKLLAAGGQAHSFTTLKNIFRDHYEGELLSPRFGAGYGTFMTICMHAMTWDASQTAASLICTYQAHLGVVSRYAVSIPCTSVYLPLYWTEYLPAALQNATDIFDDRTLWWVVERLSMAVSIDYDRYAGNVRKALGKLEEEFEAIAAVNEKEAARLIAANQREEAYKLLNAQMDAAVEKTLSTATALYADIRDTVQREGGLAGPRADFLKSYSQRTQMNLI